MVNRKRLLLLFACSGVLAWTADWLNQGGDPQRSGWQRREDVLNAESVRGLRLIWKRQLEKPGIPLSAPVMVRRVVTYRGSVELVFVASATGNVYAVDTDFGTVFWKRPTEAANAPSVATPVLSPLPDGADEDDDGPPPPRPLYVLAASGQLYALNPGDGKDAAPARQFLPANSGASSLNLFRGTVYTGTAAGMWSLGMGTEPRFLAGKTNGVTIGTDGGAHATGGCALRWRGRDWIAGVGREGQVVLRNAVEPPVGGAVATWEDAAGVRWLCAATPRAGLATYRVEEKNGQPLPVRAWTSQPLVSPSTPVMAGGVVFALDSGTLHAWDAATGKHLYSSRAEAAPRAAARTSELAVANGHICFTASDGILYCFGFPVDV